jgi:Heterokaryon incompatibility protein (HET)
MTSILKTCLTKHYLCPPAGNVKLPKRTLAFERSTSGDITVKLQKNKGQKGRYTALSHCWGSSQTCITTSKTLGEFKNAIPWTALPKTFQDSIIFSLKLGIHYLWIDALCIIQDNPSDWQIESAKMADIYQNSFLTLAATASNSDSGGCFSISHAPVAEYELKAHASLMKSCPIVVRKKLQHWTVPPTQASMQLHPLLSRGWAFQERILAPRVLHFCKQELVWECKEETKCQCGGLSTHFSSKDQLYQVIRTEGSDSRNDDHPMRKLLRSLRARTPRITAREQSDVSKKWHSIVELYSALQLTKETDRLPALSGLAKQASPRLGKYLAGLWSNTLVSDLMWKVNKLEFGFGRPVKYTGPSWSWASINGPVSYWQDLENMDDSAARDSRAHGVIFELREKAQSIRVSCNVQAAGKNPFGEIASGALDIIGYLQMARLRSGYHLHTKKEIVPLKYELKIPGTEALELSFFADYVLSEEGPHNIPHYANIHLLLVHPYVCLVLKVDESSRRRTFQRIRIFRRIGIVRLPIALVNLYFLDWMIHSTLTRVRII